MSILPIMAQQFYHSSQTHNTQYSSSTIVTDPHSNNKINNVLVTYVGFIWSALGDRSSSTKIRSNEASYHNFSRADLDNAAKKAYSSASARATKQQASAVMHLMNNFQHAFVLFGCGTGKSTYTSCNISLVAYMVSIVRRVLLSPHTTLYLQCIIYKLRSISSEQACAWRSYFHPMMDKHPIQLQLWNIKNIFIDEYHNIFGELFCHTNSWTSLRNLVRHNIKITNYQQRLTHYSWTLLVIILGWETIRSLGS